MASVGLLPAISLLAGVSCGTVLGIQAAAPLWILPVLTALAVVAWQRRVRAATVAATSAAFLAAGAALAADARVRALEPSLRTLLDEEFGGFAIESIGPEGDHDPLAATAVLTEDAAVRDGFVSLRGHLTGVELPGASHVVSGGIGLTVGGSVSARRAGEWRAGRTIRAPLTFRRPVRYLNDGVPDFERDLALGGTTLFGSIKSGLLVEVTARGSPMEEVSADVRAHVREVVTRRIGSRDPVSGGIVTAVLIGDRTGLPDEIRDRLQAAGTYHVIAISGGNIAILAGAAIGALMLVGIRGRAAAVVTIVVLLAYAQIVTSGPSVWRATMMAVVYLVALAADHRTPAWQATAVSAGLMVVVHPLDVRDPGFILTFGATAALLEGARRGAALLPRHRVASWMLASVVASLAAEIALLPISAQTFSRVTIAGLLLNLLAVPLMGVVQMAGMATVALDRIEALALAAAACGHGGASLLVGSARLVEIAPWLTARVAPPGAALIAVYYGALVAALAGRRRVVRIAGAAATACAMGAIVTGARAAPAVSSPDSRLRLTMFDVGQAEALLLQFQGHRLLIDAGGVPFGAGGFDIGARVLAPALWASGVRSLDALLVTHGDPDHLGGAQAMLAAFDPAAFWEGIHVPSHRPMRDLRHAAARSGAQLFERRAGENLSLGPVRIRVLHPPEPDWERQRVRNDDSVVLEVVHGDVAVLLTGDITAAIERSLLPRLTPARTRILKVAHHGSRTSTSRELVDAWRPQVALISAGRGNTFGHPAPDVVRRLEEAGATILRTDRHGQITVETDGTRVSYRTRVSP